MASLLPILISSVTATCFSYLFTGEASMFNFHTDDIFQLDRLPATILLGVGCGFVSIYFMRTMSWCEDGYARLAKRPYVKLLMGGLTLSTLIFLFPSLYGEGYDTLAVFIEGKTETDWDTVMQESLFAGKGEYLVLYVALVPPMARAVVVVPLPPRSSSADPSASSSRACGISMSSGSMCPRRTSRSMAWRV